MKKFLMFVLECVYLGIAGQFAIGLIEADRHPAIAMDVLLFPLLILSFPLGGAWLLLVRAASLGGSSIAAYYGWPNLSPSTLNGIILFTNLMTIPIGHWQWFVGLPKLVKAFRSKRGAIKPPAPERRDALSDETSIRDGLLFEKKGNQMKNLKRS